MNIYKFKQYWVEKQRERASLTNAPKIQTEKEKEGKRKRPIFCESISKGQCWAVISWLSSLEICLRLLRGAGALNLSLECF